MLRPFALIVEDDRMLADIFSSALKNIEYETEIMRNGRSASLWLQTNVPDLLVLDLHLPYLSGEDILKQVNADARFDKTKIMIVTADAAMAKYLEGNITLTLIKPVDVGQLQKLAYRLKPEQPQAQ
ncbi:MAG: response regulator [Chloroflexota bacterium]|jgi:DNA-binding response OmpR family regulator